MGERLVLRGIDAAHLWQCACTSAVSPSCAELRKGLTDRIAQLEREREQLRNTLEELSPALAERAGLIADLYQANQERDEDRAAIRALLERMKI